MGKLNVLVVCGGTSAEHEVSIQSARSIVSQLDKSKYDIELVCIDKKGVWFWIDDINSIFNYPDYKTIPTNELGKVATLQFSNPAYLCSSEKQKQIDVAFPILHGFLGEDGAIQGLFKVARIPFVGSDVLSSAVCMDKNITKILVQSHDIPVAKYEVFEKSSAVPSLDYPVFVKPANTGSSVGISKVKNKNELQAAMKLAFRYDQTVLVEECIDGLECEVALLGNSDVRASAVGAIIPTKGHEFYSYEAKYLDKDAAKLIIPAEIEQQVSEKMKLMAIKIYKILGCKGMARADFFVKENGQIIFNEINTIPGFTQISMYPSLWLHSGMKYKNLLDELITLARA